MSSPLFPRPARLFALLASTALLSAAPPLPDGHLVTERGPHHRVVRWLTMEKDEAGNDLTITNAVTELASGMHYADERGAWQESVAEFVATPNGFVAARGPHQVALARNLRAAGAVTLVTPEGQTLRSTPALLAYVDRVTGESGASRTCGRPRANWSRPTWCSTRTPSTRSPRMCGRSIRSGPLSSM